LYLQGQPGTYASLSIPGLDTFKNTNRIIHRAELIIEQVPTDPINDVTFAPPNYLYLDLKDTGTSVPVRYKPIYLDLNTSEFYDPDNSLGFYPTTVDFSYFGGFIRKKTGPGSSFINYYDINISRYIQQLVKNHGTNYKFRLFPAYSIHYPQYFAYRDYYNSIAYGRVKVGSGSNTAYPMRLRIIYSKLK
jgi:WD40 repeat protein